MRAKDGVEARDASWRVGVLVVLFGVFGALAVFAASERFPSPARETVYVTAEGRRLDDRPLCHGMVVIDGPVVWAICAGDRGFGPNALMRFDTRNGRATRIGALPTDASGLRAGIAGPGRSRVFLAGNVLFEVLGTRLRVLGTVTLPIGLAKVGDGVEVVLGTGDSGLAVGRYENGRLRETRTIARGVHSTDAVVAEPVRAYHDGTAWHVLVLEHARVAPRLPLPVVVHDQNERGETRLVGRVSLDDRVAQRDDTGAVFPTSGWFLAGNVIDGSISAREQHLYRDAKIERVLFPGAPYLGVVSTFISDDAHARLVLSDTGERMIWIDGETITRRTIDRRFNALTVGERRGPVTVASFWMEPGFRVVPHDDGRYTLIGALGGSYVALDHNLRRADGLTIFERLRRLFYEDRAKRNADALDGAGVLAFLTVPLMLLGPLVGGLVLGLRRRRRGLAMGIGTTWLVLAMAGAYHFAYVLRFYF